MMSDHYWFVIVAFGLENDRWKAVILSSASVGIRTGPDPLFSPSQQQREKKRSVNVRLAYIVWLLFESS